MDINPLLRETNWFHAANFIWLYDATGTGWKNKTGISSPIQFSIDTITPKQDYQVFSKQERIALLLPKNNLLKGQKSKDQLRLVHADTSEENLKVNDADLQIPANQITQLQGSVDDASKKYNPRFYLLNLVTLNPQNKAANAIALFQNAAITPRSKLGTVFGRLVLEAGDKFPWAVLTLNIVISLTQTLEFRAQANQWGEFVIPLKEFPALDKDSLASSFAATLHIQACAMVNELPNLDQLTSVTMKELTTNNFSAQISFQISPGDQLRLQSNGGSALVIKL